MPSIIHMKKTILIYIATAAILLAAPAAMSQDVPMTPYEKFYAVIKEYRLMPKGGRSFARTYAQNLDWDLGRDSVILARMERVENSGGILYANEYYTERISEMAGAWRDSMGLEGLCASTWQKRSDRAFQKAEARCYYSGYDLIESAMRTISREERRDVVVSLKREECRCPDPLFRYIMDESSEDMLELRNAIKSKRLRYLAVAQVSDRVGMIEIFAEYRTGLFKRRFRAVPVKYMLR